MELSVILYLIGTYILASIPFGYVVGKLFGKDVTKEGSGNIGATNVTRTIGKKAGALVLILDMLKGYFPVYFGKHYMYFDDRILSMIAITAVLGHCFSVFMKFKGGKGVATGLGVLLALSGKTAFIVILLWLGSFLTTGYVSFASIFAAFMSWIIIFYVEDNVFYTFAALFLSFIIVLKHSSNINRLIKGTESRFLHR
ncbi:MAG TPA: acyl-phosphate glycerol 3-phosphate acyltransferase [Persephonella sp.]|uniref:Glycerol-3-phosphate acyltransferase n=1 Tax=Persephonella marina (strain DSM 14350 / EX-H1) TaxID=123214 RepID=C0QUN9_PERMH|nr:MULTISPECIES: glycerol-3-phosphate 1-O-acyltransferase PlsY [Persephonella]ACO03118.1 acyl-phosphate glycerol 3-phosphate acyltransferase [Persephonella marina EX-H1]HCB69980.1 acyl-phosphate glycerol 3-phosphate acyltransferase [Persephonella sp.]